MTEPTGNAPAPAEASAASTPAPPSSEPSPAESPIVDVKADPMMMQVIQGSGEPRDTTFFTFDGDY